MNDDYYPGPDELRDAWRNESTSFPGEEDGDTGSLSETEGDRPTR